jgi:hypothetical protein
MSAESTANFPISSLAQSDDGRFLAYSAGPHVCLCDASHVLASTRDLAPTHRPTALVRTVSISIAQQAGQKIRLAAVCDDKRLYAYEFVDGGSLRLVGMRAFKKRPITCAFAGGPDCIAVADRFGDAFLCDWAALRADGPVPEQDEFAADFGTLSTITALLPLPAASRRLAAANRDEQVFIVRLPEVYEITAFCLGHEAFVTSLAYTTPAAAPHLTVLLSAGGDASVRAWNAITGAPLAELQLRANHTPLATITGVEPVLAPELVIRALAAFDNDVYYVTQPGNVYRVRLGAAAESGALNFVGSPEIVIADRRVSCIVAVAQGVWIATNDGSIELHTIGSSTPIRSIAGTAIQAPTSAEVTAILKEIDPMLFQHQFDSNTRERGGAGGDDEGEQDDNE